MSADFLEKAAAEPTETEDGFTCVRCHAPCSLRSGDEPTSVCDRCAQHIVAVDLPVLLERTKAAVTEALSAPFLAFALDMPLAEVEKSFILAVLKAHEGNKSSAAESLGIARRTLYNMLGRWGLQRDTEEGE